MFGETRYTPGSALLLVGAGRLALVDDPEDVDVVDRLWQLLNDPRTGIEELWARVTEVPSVRNAVLVDRSGGTDLVSRQGNGQLVRDQDGGFVSLGPATDDLPSYPLGHGVVHASQARLGVRADETLAPVPGAGSDLLIDGIPDEILAASAPAGPPVNFRLPGPGRQDTETGERRPLGPQVPATAPRHTVGAHVEVPRHPWGEPVDDPDTVETRLPHPAAGTGGAHAVEQPGPWAGLGTGADVPELDDTRETPPHVGGGRTPGREDSHTRIAARRAERAQAGGSDPDHLTAPGTPTVMAVWCPQGHPSAPSAPLCRVCDQPVAPQQARPVARPVLGGLRLPTGEVVPVDRSIVVGRRASPLPGGDDWPHLVHLGPEYGFVSRLHLQVVLDGWQVLAQDLGSRGGTTLTLPGHSPVLMQSGEFYALEAGSVLELGEAYSLRFEPARGPG